MNSSYDPEVDAYYFGPERSPSVKTVDLGIRQVYVDIDINGRIIGVEVL